MPKLSLFYQITLFCYVLSASTAVAATYRGFNAIHDDQCVVLRQKEMLSLPQVWQKYSGFVKSCQLKKDEVSKPKIFLISIWGHDYLDSQHKDTWEKFPLPILVDSEFRQCGTLPELYPASYVNSLYVSYGKWKSGVPAEIRIDVADPTVTGDYYYAPMLWDDRDHKYKMKTVDPISGKRRR